MGHVVVAKTNISGEDSITECWLSLQRGITPLMKASYDGYTVIVDSLLKYRADPDAVDNVSLT